MWTPPQPLRAMQRERHRQQWQQVQLRQVLWCQVSWQQVWWRQVQWRQVGWRQVQWRQVWWLQVWHAPQPQEVALPACLCRAPLAPSSPSCHGWTRMNCLRRQLSPGRRDWS